MRISLRQLPGEGPEVEPVEVVERKGLGHPDSICDALAEAFSLALSRFYRDRFGAILHHNVDKVLLVGGRSEPAFGGGAVREPIEITLAGRAVCAWRGVTVPVEEIAREACEGWLAAHLHALDARAHVRIGCRVRPGAAELVELVSPQAGRRRALANDTSIGVGFAPLSELEAAVLDAEAALNARAVRRDSPALGEDVKVMGVREGGTIRLTVACAMIDRTLADLDAYRAARARAAGIAADAVRARTRRSLELAVNAGDDDARGLVYLTVTGTSAESGDDGEAGRGNRANGLITPYRPMTLESVAGKNPVGHVGKLYNLAAGLLAERLVAELADVLEAHVLLVSRIGAPVDDPPLADLRLRRAEGAPAAALAASAEEIARSEVARIPALADELLDGRLALDRWPLRRPAGEGPGGARG
jgi:S-adenosylmethionine synthetase